MRIGKTELYFYLNIRQQQYNKDLSNSAANRNDLIASHAYNRFIS